MKAKTVPSGNFLVAVSDAIDDCPEGARHLVGMIEPGPRGMTLATVGVAVVDDEGCGRLPDVEAFPFERRVDARSFVMSWLWCRIHPRKKARP